MEEYKACETNNKEVLQLFTTTIDGSKFHFEELNNQFINISNKTTIDCECFHKPFLLSTNEFYNMFSISVLYP